jgi:hypothetical protein
MGFNSADPYYQPEKFDLTIIDSLDLAGAYEFDMLIVWKHSDGRLFYAFDSGCSCPSPFEGYTRLEDLTEIKSYGEFKKEVEEWGGTRGEVHSLLMEVLREMPW